MPVPGAVTTVGWVVFLPGRPGQRLGAAGENKVPKARE